MVSNGKLSSGKLVHFDSVRGFGFVAPDDGGEDLFIHVNDFEESVSDERLLRPGRALEFEVEYGGKGMKAVNVRLCGEAEGESPAAARPRERTEPREKAAEDRSQEQPARAQAGQDWEVTTLSSGDFALEITEILLDASDSLTTRQVLTIRRRFAEFAQARGWVRDA